MAQALLSGPAVLAKPSEPTALTLTPVCDFSGRGQILAAGNTWDHTTVLRKTNLRKETDMHGATHLNTVIYYAWRYTFKQNSAELDSDCCDQLEQGEAFGWHVHMWGKTLLAWFALSCSVFLMLSSIKNDANGHNRLTALS